MSAIHLLTILEDPVFAVPAVVVLLAILLLSGICSYQNATRTTKKHKKNGLDHVSKEVLEGGTEYVQEDGLEVRRSKRCLPVYLHLGVICMDRLKNEKQMV